jgi:predicted secreted protein
MSSNAKLGLSTVLGIQATTSTGGLDIVAIHAAGGGLGNVVNDVLTVVQSGASGGTLLVTTVDGSGTVTALTRLTPGLAYFVASNKSTTSSNPSATPPSVDIAHICWPVAELDSVAGPSVKVATVNVTNMDSTATDGKPWAEFLAGVIDGGNVTFSGNFTNETGQAQALADLEAKTSRTWEILFPGALGTYSFTGYVVGCNPDAKHDKQLTFTMELKVSGVVLFTA